MAGGRDRASPEVSGSLSSVILDMTEAFEARGLGATMDYGARPALLVVDLQRAFTDPRFPLGADVDGTVEAVVELISHARASSVPVIFTTCTWAPGADTWSRKMPAQREIVTGSPWAQLDPRLTRTSDEVLVEKHFASAFFRTGLHELLREREVDSVILTGVTTSGCIRATAVDAVSNGYRVAVPKEAVADRSEATHLMSLFDLHAKYADVVVSADVKAHFVAVAGRHPSAS